MKPDCKEMWNLTTVGDMPTPRENWLFFLEQLFFGMSWKYEDILTLFLTQFTLVEFLTHASKVTKIVWHAKKANWLT